MDVVECGNSIVLHFQIALHDLMPFHYMSELCLIYLLAIRSDMDVANKRYE